MAKGTRSFAGPYEQMDFAPYKYQEYPKAIRRPDPTDPDNPRKGSEIVVENEVEERELLGTVEENPEAETVNVGRRRGR